MKILSKRARVDINLDTMPRSALDFIDVPKLQEIITYKIKRWPSKIWYIGPEGDFTKTEAQVEHERQVSIMENISIQGTLKNGSPKTYSLHDDAMHQEAELTRCQHDPVYFITEYCRLENRSALRDVVMGLEENKRIVVKHPRQIGITSTSLAYALWKAMFQPNQTILFATVNSMMACTAHLQFGAMYDALPIWLKVPLHHRNRHLYNLANSSVVTFTAMSERLAKGQRLDLLILDSFALNRQELKEAVWWLSLPVISRDDAQLLVASTPCNSQDMFAEIWRQAKAGHPFLHPVELSFHQLPEATQDRFRDQRLAFGVEAFWRECLGNFTHGELYQALVKTNAFSAMASPEERDLGITEARYR